MLYAQVRIRPVQLIDLIVIIEIIVMMKNNRDVNYLHSYKKITFCETFAKTILGQMPYQNCHNPNNRCIIN